MPQNKFLDQHVKLKYRQKNHHLWKTMLQKCIFMCCFSKLEMLFKKQDFYISMKGKNNLATSNSPNRKSHKDLTWSYLCQFAQENNPPTQPRSRSFFAGTSLLLFLETIDKFEIGFLLSFFFNIETKLKQRIWQNTEEKPLYCTYCHTNAWSHLISLLYYSQFQFYYAKLLDTPEEVRQVLGFIKIY